MIKTAMVFGVFDGLHQGHKNFLEQASQKCENLIVVVALSEVVHLLKGKLPKYSHEERAEQINSFYPRFKIIFGDSVPGQWNVITKYKPDIIFLGYDQQGIAQELIKIKVPFEMLLAYKPELYKSSINNLIT